MILEGEWDGRSIDLK